MYCSISYAEIEIIKDTRNIISSRIEGSWIINHEESKKLWGKEKLEEKEMWNLTIRRDDDVLKKLQPRYADRLIKAKAIIYFAGWIRLINLEYPCIIIDDKHGNNALVFFMQNDLDKANRSETDFNSVKAMLVVGHTLSFDKLFLGGIRTSSGPLPFYSYHRKK